MPPRREADITSWVESWESFAEQQVREAISRGEFDNLPGTGRPIDLGEDNPFEGDMGPAYRLARNAGVAPGWVSIGQEIETCLTALDALLQAVPRSPFPPDHMGTQAAIPDPGWWGWLKQLWFGPPRSVGRVAAVPTRAVRAVARARFLARAAHADSRIRAYNAQLPRGLAWLERPRLTPAMAAARFDDAWPAAAVEVD